MKKFVIIWLNTLFLLVLVLLAINRVILWNNWTVTISVWSLSTLIVQLLSLKYLKFTISSFSVWFVLLSHIFMFGRIYLNAVGADREIFWNLITRYDIMLMLKAAYYILLCIQISFVALVLFSNDAKAMDRKQPPKKNVRLFNTGVIVLLLSFPVKFVGDLRAVIHASETTVYTSATSSSGLMIQFGMLVLPGILAIIFSRVLAKKTVTILVSLSVSYLLLPIIFTGDRRYAVVMILSIILAYLKEYQVKFTWRTVLPSTYLVMIFLNILMTIRVQRVSGMSPSIVRFFEDNWQGIFFGSDFISETLAEFGLSFFSVVNLFSVVPQQISFYDGYTFLGMFLTIFPIPTGWAFPNVLQHASISNVVNPIIGYPVGATLFGDFYGNFSYLGGLLAAFIVMSLIAKLLNFDHHNIGLNRTLYFSIFFVAINLIRASAFEMFRPMIIILAVTIVTYRLCGEKKYGE